MTRIVATALMATVLAMGCSKRPPTVAEEQAAAREAAQRFVQAMNRNDAALIEQVSTGDDRSLRLLRGQAALNAARERVVAAAKAKFGSAEGVLPVQLAADHFARIAADLEKMPVAISGDSATVGSSTRLYLKKSDGAWKVDRMMLVPPGESTSDQVSVAEGFAKAYAAVAGEIESGAVQTAAEAKTLLMARSMDLIAPGGAASQPAALPSTTRPAGAELPQTEPTSPVAPAQ